MNLDTLFRHHVLRNSKDQIAHLLACLPAFLLNRAAPGMHTLHPHVVATYVLRKAELVGREHLRSCTARAGIHIR